MNTWLKVLLACLLGPVTLSSGKTLADGRTVVGSQGSEVIVDFDSWSPRSFTDIFENRRDGLHNRVQGILRLPTTATPQNPVPVVVLMHGSGGDPSLRRRRLAQKLEEFGYGSLILETFSSRLLYAGQDYLDRLRKAFIQTQLADAYAALEELRRHPEIDGDRIALSGVSMGAISTAIAAHRKIASSLSPEGHRFAAHLYYYGPCVVRAQAAQTTGAPILMMIGRDDESTPEADCRQYADYLRAAGSSVRLEVMPGPHGWDLTAAPKFKIELPNAMPCRFEIRNDGTVHEATTNQSALTIRDTVDLFAACSSPGYTSGRSEEAILLSDQIVGEFLGGVFAPTAQASR